MRTTRGKSSKGAKNDDLSVYSAIPIVGATRNQRGRFALS